MAWTDQQITELKTLILDKHTFTEIANKLGKTKNAIAGKCHRLDLTSISGAEFPISHGQPKIFIKADKMVLCQIKKYTDQHGWGLEISEIVEYTKLPFRIVTRAVKRLMKSGRINKTISHVAGHIFYNNASVKQIGGE